MLPANDIGAFPDATIVVMEYLKAVKGHDAVPISTDYPPKAPQRFITVARVGGRARNLLVDEPMVTIQCHSIDEQNASDMADWARDAMLAMDIETPAVVWFHSEISGPIKYGDPTGSRACYQFTHMLRMQRL